MKRLFIILFLCSLARAAETGFGQLAASCVAVATTGACTSFNVHPPDFIHIPQANSFTWQTIFTGGTPTAATVLLHGSIDGTTWSTLDTSTSTAGETRSKSGTAVNYFRCNVTVYTPNGTTLGCQITPSWVEPGGSGGGAVDSVNGATGAVTLDAADVGAATPADVTTAVANKLSDPGNNGLVKRTAANTTVPAVSGTDYVPPADLTSGLALKLNASEKAAASGVGSLDSATKLVEPAKTVVGDPAETDPGVDFFPSTDKSVSAAGHVHLYSDGGVLTASQDAQPGQEIGIFNPPLAITGATYTVLTTDKNRFMTFVTNSAVITLPCGNTTTFKPGFELKLKNDTFTTQTIAADTGCTIDAAASTTFTNYQTVTVVIQADLNWRISHFSSGRAYGAYEVFGNMTGSTAPPTRGVLVAAAIPSLDTAKITTGTWAAARMPAHTGDATSSAGSVALTIPAGTITDAKAALSVKPSATLVAVANLTLSGAQTIDSVAGTVNQTVVLATAQTAGAENGPWVMQTAAWTRPTWWPAAGTTQAIPFSTILVRLGTVYANSTWRMTTTSAVTIDTTATVWAQTTFGSWLPTGGAPNPAANGILACTGTACSTASARTITAGTGISISNGDGVSGNPTITATGSTTSGNKRLNRQGTVSAITGNSAMQTLYTYTVPANSIAAEDCLRAIVFWGHTGSNSITYQWKFGATATSTTTTNVGSGGTSSVLVCNNGATNSQFMRTFATQIATTLDGVKTASPAEDTTGTVALAFQFNGASPDTVNGVQFVVETVHD